MNPHLIRAQHLHEVAPDARGADLASWRYHIMNTVIVDIAKANPGVDERAKDRAKLIDVTFRDDMPPDPADVRFLLDALCFKLRSTKRADAWREIGINPNRGRDLLGRNSRALDWPIWFTLVKAVVG